MSLLDTIDAESRQWRDKWTLPDDVVYLNHGSFGPSPKVVQEARQKWIARLESQPMQFFVRDREAHLDEAAARLAAFVGCDTRDLLFTDNATVGMNLVAANADLQPGDEVLLTNHEYGAVTRIWRTVCQKHGADLVVAPLPVPIESSDHLLDALFAAVTEKTRLVVVSHVASPTAVIMPVAEICRRAHEHGIEVCVDGPHAVAMLPLDVSRIDPDYYVASCHKWLSAPFGSGFLYVARRHQQEFKPQVVSWGRSLSGRPFSWKDEFHWQGTGDPSAYLAVPAAIDFLGSCGLEKFRRQTHALAAYARRRILDLTSLEPIATDAPEWFGSMIAMPLPDNDTPPPKYGEPDPLQQALWDEYRIEVVVNRWLGLRNVRMSCHLYNNRAEIDRLVEALDNLLYRRRL